MSNSGVTGLQLKIIPASSWSLDAFRAVVTHRSFTNAAASLRITQPALSTRIRLLEELLGRPVFTRGRRGVTLTAVGDRLLEYIKFFSCSWVTQIF
jgi:hypothetical protein